MNHGVWIPALLLGLATLSPLQTSSCGAPDPTCTDVDGDGYGDGSGCQGLDCDDGDAEVNPGQYEACGDGVDNNCDGSTDGDDLTCVPASPLELYPNLHTVGVNIALGEGVDPEGDVVATPWFRRVSEATWRQGFAFTQATGVNRLSGALLRLDPGTTYEVRVEVVDPTTPALNTSYLGTVTTRAEPVAPTPTRVYVVAPSGAGDACDDAQPCALPYALEQVRAGEGIEMVGGVYRVGGLVLRQSGTRDAPITIYARAGAEAVWDGSDGVEHTWAPVSGSPGLYVTELTEANANTNCVVADGVRLYPYRNLQDLTTHTISCILAVPQAAGIDGFYRDPRPITTVPLASPNPYYRKLYVKFVDGGDPGDKEIVVSGQTTALDLTGTSNIHLRGLTFRHYGVEPYARTLDVTDVRDLVIDGCTFDHNDRGIVLSGDTRRVVIQNSTFRDHTDWDTYLGKATYEPANPQLCYQTTPPPYPLNDRLLETGGILYGHGFAGRGVVIRGNTFAGFMDSFKAVPPSVVEGYTTAEVDVYENHIDGADDGMEVDGVAANVRVWGNVIRDAGEGISLAPPGVGPVYVFRNVLSEMRTTHATIEGYSTLQTFYGQPLKFDCPCEGGKVYFFHNTVFNPGEAFGLRIFRPTDTALFYARNNVLVSEGNHALAILTHDPSIPPIDLDQNLYFNTGILAVVSINGNPVTYTSLGALNAAYGYEAHGLNVDPRLVDPAAGDFALKVGSPAIDAGVLIPGINDGDFVGAAPDLGALEARP